MGTGIMSTGVTSIGVMSIGIHFQCKNPYPSKNLGNNSNKKHKWPQKAQRALKFVVNEI
jgi:hypothetical protein